MECKDTGSLIEFRQFLRTIEMISNWSKYFAMSFRWAFTGLGRSTGNLKGRICFINDSDVPL